VQICTALSPRTVSPSGENVARLRCGRRRCGKSLGGHGRRYAVAAGALGARSRARKPPRAGHRCRRGRGLGLGRPSPRATVIAEPPLSIWANGCNHRRRMPGPSQEPQPGYSTPPSPAASSESCWGCRPRREVADVDRRTVASAGLACVPGHGGQYREDEAACNGHKTARAVLSVPLRWSPAATRGHRRGATARRPPGLGVANRRRRCWPDAGSPS